MANKKDNNDSVAYAVLRAARAHYIYVAAYIAATVIFDSWNLITHEGVAQRWKAAVLLLLVTTVIWYLSRSKGRWSKYYKVLLICLITSDIVFAAYNVFLQRGMASKAVALFAVPIITSALLKSRRAILATATLCSAAYTFAAVQYFHQHYGEGFKVELYGEIFFYTAVFFVLSALLIGLVKPGKN